MRKVTRLFPSPQVIKENFIIEGSRILPCGMKRVVSRTKKERKENEVNAQENQSVIHIERALPRLHVVFTPLF